MNNNINHIKYESLKFNNVNIELNKDYYFNTENIIDNTEDALILASNISLSIIFGGFAGLITGYIFGNNIIYNIFKSASLVAIVETNIIACANIVDEYFDKNNDNESCIDRAIYSSIDDYKDIIDSVHFSIDYIGSYIKESVF